MMETTLLPVVVRQGITTTLLHVKLVTLSENYALQLEALIVEHEPRMLSCLEHLLVSRLAQLIIMETAITEGVISTLHHYSPIHTIVIP